MIGVVRRGVVIRGELEGSGGSASDRALQNPGLGCENPWLSFVDDHGNKDQRMLVMDS
jgi:hypothetical protein